LPLDVQNTFYAVASPTLGASSQALDWILNTFSLARLDGSTQLLIIIRCVTAVHGRPPLGALGGWVLARGFWAILLGRPGAVFHQRGGSGSGSWRSIEGQVFRKPLSIAGSVYLVQLLATALAKVFVRRAFGAEDADAGTVLPDLANVALNEEAGNILG
jgi:hypothetical protein